MSVSSAITTHTCSQLSALTCCLTVFISGVFFSCYHTLTLIRCYYTSVKVFALYFVAMVLFFEATFINFLFSWRQDSSVDHMPNLTQIVCWQKWLLLGLLEIFHLLKSRFTSRTPIIFKSTLTSHSTAVSLLTHISNQPITLEQQNTFSKTMQNIGMQTSPRKPV